jgi:tungstate transport system substrate-binding protein
VAVVGCAPAPATEPPHLRLATTTSTQDSGLLDVILPDFEAQYGVKVDVVAVGTGQALALGESGDADVLLVHDRAREDAFVEAGNAAARYDVMYNDFVIVGPADDPAGIKGAEDAGTAFTRIAESKSLFVSRGDDSGTHSKEKSIWKSVSIEPGDADEWYISAGQGMGEVLTMSEEQNAYTISDRATFLKRQSEGLKLVALVEGAPELLNHYGVIPVSAEKFPSVNTDLANKFIEWLTSEATQQKIQDYKINGQSLFIPESEAWLKAHPR